MPQDFYSELDPNHFADNLINTYDPANPMKQFNTEENEIADRMKAQLLRSQEAARNIDNYQNDLKYDPVAEASKQYRDKYKWKGQTKTTKAKTIGTGILDVLGLAAGKGLKQNIQEKTDAEFKRRAQTIPQQITNERLTENNATNAYNDLAKVKAAKEKEQAVIAYKSLLMRTSDQQKRDQLAFKVRELEEKGIPLTLAQVEKLEAESKLVGAKTVTEDETRFLKNPIGMAEWMRRNPENSAELLGNYEKIQKAIAKAKPERQFAPRILDEGGTQFELSVNPISQEVESKQVKPRTAFQITPNSVTPMQQPNGMTGPNSTAARLTPAEFKIFSDMDKTAKLLRSTSATMLNDIAKNDIDAYSGFNDSHFGRLLNGLFQDDPRVAAAWAQGPQMGSIATLQHLKAMYGGRAPQALAQDLDQLISGKMANGLGKASAIMSQQLIAEMFVLSQAKDPRATRLFSDPNFYGFLKDNMAALIGDAKAAGQLRQPVPTVPNVGKLMNDYLQRSQGTNQPSPFIVNKSNAIVNRVLELQKKNTVKK